MAALALLPEAGLRSERLQLRPPIPADLDEIVAGIGNFAVSRMLTRVPYPYARSDAEQWLAANTAQRSGGTGLGLVIVADGHVIGCVGLERLTETPVIGYWLAEPEWDKGYATEAAGAALRFSFEELGTERIRSGVLADNPASLHVQEKLGFEVVGRSTAYCLARKADVAHIDTILTRDRFQVRKS